jgi:hypothetical protein
MMDLAKMFAKMILSEKYSSLECLPIVAGDVLWIGVAHVRILDST